MHSKILVPLAIVAQQAAAFPWVVRQPGVDSSLLRRQQPGDGAGSAANCPFNPNHQGAVPITAQYPYNNASGGNPGKGVGGFQVPAPGDYAHRFIAPDYTKDIRGPCPGLNTAANHGFLSRDGIVTFNELVDAQQNVYNVGYDLAQLLAVLGLTVTDGDIVTEKLSIGCDATNRTSYNPALTGSEPGLDGHNKFEADSSLTRNDFFTHGGDDFRFNGTLFGYMDKTCNHLFNRQNLALYRKQRYDQSRAENPNFYFGPLALLLYGASSFLYALMPSGPNYVPDLNTISSFFGATSDGKGGWKSNGQEKIPANWTNRRDPYTVFKVGYEIFAQYALNPVEFGGNTGSGQFNYVEGPNGMFQNGRLNATDPKAISCFLYQMTTERIPSSLNGFITPTVDAINFAVAKLSPGFKNLGCPGALN